MKRNKHCPRNPRRQVLNSFPRKNNSSRMLSSSSLSLWLKRILMMPLRLRPISLKKIRFKLSNWIKSRFQPILFSKRLSSSQRFQRTTSLPTCLTSLRLLRKIWIQIWTTWTFSTLSLRRPTKWRKLLKRSILTSGLTQQMANQLRLRRTTEYLRYERIGL